MRLTARPDLLYNVPVNRGYSIVASVFVLVAVLRVLHEDRQLSQGFDESCHVAAGMEWLDRHSYTLDPVHPPLARYAVTLPLYWAGERFPKFSGDDPRAHNYNDVGDAILAGSGHYRRNLLLARIGILPFLCLGAIVLYLWTRKYLGVLAACLALALLSTTPSILAFAGLAYNDLPVACLQFTFLCLLPLWLAKPTWRMTFGLGLAAGLALATKFTSLLFLTAATGIMLICKWWFEHRAGLPHSQTRIKEVGRLIASACVALVVLWGTYAFSSGHVQETMGLNPRAMPSFQNFPSAIRSTARNAILWNPRIPAPELIHGFAEIWVANRAGPSGYLYGHSRKGGWWFFFPVALALKTPLPLMLLAAVGAFQVVSLALRRNTYAILMPVASAAAIMGVAMAGKYNVGTRYLLVVFFLEAVLAGFAGQFLWQHPKGRWTKPLLCGLLLWQAIATISAQHDFIAYFNELAPSDPSRALVLGCDLDCGEDLFRLGDELRSRGVSHVNLAVWTSGELSQMGLPSYEILPPFRPTSGWIAISARSRRMGEVLHNRYPPEGYSWLNSYTPVLQLDNTISVYHIPDTPGLH